MFEFELNGRAFFLQFPPFPYFNFHSVIVERDHVPQVINEDVLHDLLSMATRFPRFTVASNSDKLGTGVTNLAHRHYQGGLFDFAVYHASAWKSYKLRNAEMHMLNHPCAVVKLVSSESEEIFRLAKSLLDGWRSGEIAGVQRDLQTCSLVAKFENGAYALYFVPRNAEAPRFLTRASIQAVKKEFLGIFEMIGYAILPGRNKDQMEIIKQALLGHAQLPDDMSSFRAWIDEFCSDFDAANADASMLRALQRSFVEMVKDNSPLRYNDEAAFENWIAACPYIADQLK